MYEAPGLVALQGTYTHVYWKTNHLSHTYLSMQVFGDAHPPHTRCALDTW